MSTREILQDVALMGRLSMPRTPSRLYTDTRINSQNPVFEYEIVERVETPQPTHSSSFSDSFTTEDVAMTPRKILSKIKCVVKRFNYSAVRKVKAIFKSIAK